MTWLSILESNYLVLPSWPTGGSNLMVPVVSSHLLSMVMWAGPSPWQFSGLHWLRVWQRDLWRECSLDQLQLWTGLSWEMTNPGMLECRSILLCLPYNVHFLFSFSMMSIYLFLDLRPAIRLLWPSRMRFRISRKLVLLWSKLMSLP